MVPPSKFRSHLQQPENLSTSAKAVPNIPFSLVSLFSCRPANPVAEELPLAPMTVYTRVSAQGYQDKVCNDVEADGSSFLWARIILMVLKEDKAEGGVGEPSTRSNVKI